MEYLISGGSGFIGRKLVRALLTRGDGVNYLSRQRAMAMDSRAAYHLWDGKTLPPLNSVPRLNGVVHLMGEPVAQRWTAQVKERIRASRINTTRQLVKAIGELKHKPSVLVSASAIGYYGSRGDEILTEKSAPGAGFLAEVCQGWEREALRAEELGVRVVLIRIATVLGADGGALEKMLTPFRLGIGGKFGDGKQWMSWINVNDLVKMMLFALDNPVSGALNGSAPNPVINAEFTQVLAHAIKRPAVLPVPKFALQLLLGEMAGFLFDSIRAVPEAALSAGFEFQYPKLDEALRAALA